MHPAKFIPIGAGGQFTGKPPPEGRFCIGSDNLPHPGVLKRRDSVFKRRHQSAGSRTKSVDDLFFAVRKASQGPLAEDELIIEPDLENSSPPLDDVIFEGERI